ncbi:hypothetical protein [Noviherbaspirillum agri]
MTNTTINTLKSIQQFSLFAAVTFLFLSIVCAYNGNGVDAYPSTRIFRPLFVSVSNDVWGARGVPLLLILQLVCLMTFFGIAIYIGLKILPIPLSENDKKEVITSPYEAFNRMVFSRTLLGGVKRAKNQMLDLRNLTPTYTADVYLIHFDVSGKKNFLAFLFIFGFVVPNFVSFSSKAEFVQLLINFALLNLYFFFLYDVVLLVSSKIFIKGKRNA